MLGAVVARRAGRCGASSGAWVSPGGAIVPPAPPRAFPAAEPRQHERCSQVRGQGSGPSQSGEPCQAGTARQSWAPQLAMARFASAPDQRCPGEELCWWSVLVQEEPRCAFVLQAWDEGRSLRSWPGAGQVRVWLEPPLCWG